MKYLKIVTAAVLLLSMLVSFCACVDDAPAESSDTESREPESSSEVHDGLRLFAHGESDYCIVYSSEPSDVLFSAVRRLADAFKEKGGVSLKLKEEGLDTPFGNSDACEILVGVTGRAESEEVCADMTDKGSYAVAAEGNKLVLYGADAENVAKAVDWFIKQFLREQRTELYFTASDNYYNTRIGIITSAMINGQELENFRIVVPAEGYIEEYIAEVFCDYLFSFYGRKTPTIVTDKTAESANEILIGQTNRSKTQADSAKYKLTVNGTKLYAVSDSVGGYIEVLEALKKLFPYSNSTLTLNDGEWTGDAAASQKRDDADLSFMFHNVLGYVDKYPAANRPDMALQIYLEYAPDIIGMQECGESYYRSYAKTLFSGLTAAGYREIVFKSQGGTGNPIFYNSSKLTLVESGYSRARSGDKGTTWAVFTDKSGKMLAVTNSHFAANSNAGGSAEKGNEYRVADAQNLLSVVSKIKEKYPNVPIINGGDFNASMSADPGKTLKNGGLVHATEIAAKSADYSAWIGYPVYDDEKEYYLPRGFVWANIAGALDHVMLGGDTSGINVLEYAVLKDRISCVVSDHLPQLLYVDWK